MDKKEWRRLMKQKLQAMDQDERNRASSAVHRELFESQIWNRAKSIAITVSREFELPTRPVIERAWIEGKNVSVPKCDPISRSMQFRSITSFDELEIVYMDLCEPIESLTYEVDRSEVDLMFVPGLVFSRDGYRIGYGGGYYDRYLEHFKNKTAAMAFSFQVEESLPTEPFDIPVAAILTENGWIER
ncbi:5-formyltetrahydrofolate cyclo-ligase [Fictibacillus aquaticus]|uniref:5-formyltetrahydrofolate cyclo-ligase n=1 Tax=Fictibacillus aquaticus TaxID=2021314 RepID=UPI001F0AC53E|nr:5-formyltetrahydrofolate cyclo-ligase [Fictibacillus aquaticus]